MKRTIATLVASLVMAVGLSVPAGADPPEPTVVGGTPAKLGEFPWTVHIRGPQFLCGGSMLTRSIVLTAAHCVGPTGPTTAYTIRATVIDLQSPRSVLVNSNHVHRAPGFVDVEQGRDWALIRLSTPVNVPTIPIATTAQYNNGTFTVAGWGSTSEGGPGSRFLLKANVPFVPDSTCRTNYQNAGFGYVDDAMLCAGFLGGGIDTCQGDSGGPMFRRDNANNWIQVGITSWGNGCARPNFPGIYTEVSTYAAEISSVASSLDPTDDDFIALNSASFEAGPLATGGFITLYTSTPVTNENQGFPFPWPDTTPAGLYVETDSCQPTGRKRLPITYAGPSGFGGTQINLYYPNDYFGDENTEPFGTCAVDGQDFFTVHRQPGLGGDLRMLVPTTQVRPGIFTNGSAPAGYHLNAVTGATTTFDTCISTGGSACPVSTQGVQNFLIAFTTGAEKMGCPTASTPCNPPFPPVEFALAPPGGSYEAQPLTFFGWAGFLGQEQANIQIKAGTEPGEKRLRLTVPPSLDFYGSDQQLTIHLGAAN